MAESKAVVPRTDQFPERLSDQLKSLLPSAAPLLPADITVEQFRAALWLELSGRTGLYACSADSLRSCVVKAATYGLLPGRDAHFLPFTVRGVKHATFVPNYMGILRALYRTGMVAQAFAEVVYSNDIFDLDYGRPQPLVHKPPRARRGEPEGAYGYILTKGSSAPLVHYMAPEDLDRVRKTSPAHESGPWVTAREEMFRKTAMKNVAKYAPLTPGIQQFLVEEAVRGESDISAARHLKNVNDLFDNRPLSSTPIRGAHVEEDAHASTQPAGAKTPQVPDGLETLFELHARYGMSEGAFTQWIQKQQARFKVSVLSAPQIQALYEESSALYAAQELQTWDPATSSALDAELDTETGEIFD